MSNLALPARVPARGEQRIFRIGSQRNLDVMISDAFDRLEDAFSLGVIYGGKFR